MHLRSFIVLFLLLVATGTFAKDQPFSAVQSCAQLLGSSSTDSKIDYFHIAKRADAFGMTSLFSVDGQLNESVAPDVVYSWMSPGILERILANATPENLLKNINRPYYLWRTPVGSFGYGEVSVRLKIKPGVKFVLIKHMHPSDSDYAARYAELQKTYDFTNTVFVSEIPIAGFHEYTVFEGGPIASISAGTPEHLQEIEGEANRILNHNSYEDFDLIFKLSPEDGNRIGSLTEPVEFDKRMWSREGLKERVLRMQRMLSENPQGRILFSKDTPPQRADHFRSKLKPYWEP